MSGKTKRLLTLLLLLFIGIVALPVHSFVPEQINYQGMLSDTAGIPVPDNTYEITFTLYDGLSAVLWSETQSAVNVTNGVFTTMLPLNPAASPFPSGLFDEELFLGITVGSDGEMAPRQPLFSVPFSFKAHDSDTLAGHIADDFADAVHSHDFSNISGIADDVQIPDNITVDNATNAANASNADNLNGRDSTSFADAVHGHSFAGITGQATDSQVPDNITITFSSQSGNADTVDGQHASAFMGIGTDNWVNTSGDTMYGRLEAESTIIGTGWGESIKGILNTPTNGAGVYGVSGGTSSYGVAGGATGTNGAGVYGEAIGDNGIGVKGDANGIGGIGVWGEGPDWAGFFLNKVKIGPNSIWTSGQERGIYFGDEGYVFIGEKDFDDQLTLKATHFYFENGTVELSGNLHIPNNSSIVNAHGRQVFHTGWTGLFGDYTTINSGYDWTSDEPVSVVAGTHGVFFTKGDGSGTPHAETLASISTSGHLSCNVLEIKGGSDLAEPFDIRDSESVTAGMLMAIDPENPGMLKAANQAYDTKVAGVVSGAGGINPGMVMGQEGMTSHGSTHIALSGRVYCLADAVQGAIKPGDMLTTSNRRGHAMKASDRERSYGAVIGKAMTELDEGTGLVLVLVSLQ